MPENLTTLKVNALADSGQHQGEGTYGSATDGIESIVVPSGVTSIGQDAFTDLQGLKTLYIPAGVTTFHTQQLHVGTENTSSDLKIVVYPKSTSTEDLTAASGLDSLNSNLKATLTNFSEPNGNYLYCSVCFPSAALLKVQGLASLTGDEDEAITKVLEASDAYGALSAAELAAPVVSDELKKCPSAIDAAADKVWAKLVDGDATTAAKKLAILNSMLAAKNAEIEAKQKTLDEANEALKKAQADYAEAQRKWIAANEVATSVTSMKANYERQLKEAQTKLEEANAKVEEAQTKLDEVQKTSADALAKIEAAQKEAEAQKAKAEAAQKEAEANKAQAEEEKAKVIILQDKLALSGVSGGTKAVKLKNGKTKAKATVKLKLAKSESGAAVACAKAKGTSKKVSVSKGGAITLKKGVKKGTYKAVVTLSCGDQVKTVTYRFKAA